MVWVYTFVDFSQQEHLTYTYIRSRTTWLIHLLEARMPQSFIYSKHENHTHLYWHVDI